MKFGIRATHKRGVDNLAADALSQGNILLIGSCCPQGDLDQTQIPVEILNTMLLREPDLGARDWTNMWISILTAP